MTCTNTSKLRPILAMLTVLMVVASVGRAAAQTVDRNDVLYILPLSAIGTDAAAIADLRARLAPNGDGPYVKIGFSQYVFLAMEDWNVNPFDPVAVRAKIAGSIANINGIVANARANGFPVALAILNAAKETYDPVQRASEAEDIRSMQWYADGVLAPGWWSYSPYARKRYLVQQAYMREVAKEIAKLMRDFPDTLVAASGDGEVELARSRPAPADLIYADYSPFTVAEFRDWIRLGGMYATGGELAGQGYAFGARYAGDRTPAEDTNGDGHTFNGDFGTGFIAWNLLHFDWSLDDRFMSTDPHAISLATYSSPAFNKLPAEIPGGFDPPRTPRTMGTNAWWDIWVLFKQTMIQRYNVEFAKWMTTSPAPSAADAAVEADSGYTIPHERWYSYQIPADYMFGGSPSNPNDRWFSSMSSWWTADISPYGSYGITSFNVDWIDASFRIVARTLPAVAPKIAERNLRWGVIEWHPGMLRNDACCSTDMELYRSEMAVVEKYRPSLLQPFMWGNPGSELMGTGFETALAEMIARIKDGKPPSLVIDLPASGTAARQPVSLTGWAADFNKSPGGGPGIDQVDVYANPASGASAIFLGSATYGVTRADVASTYGSQFGHSGFSLTIQDLPLGRYVIEARGHSTVSQSFNVTTSVTVDLVNFAGPANGGGWSGTISGSNLVYNGATYPIVNGRVSFPDCTTYIVGGNGALMGGSSTPNCTPGTGGSTPTTPTIMWTNPASVVAGTVLGATQLNAMASVPGAFVYSPAAGTALTAGTQTLATTFTPSDTVNYTTATATVTMVVTTPSTPTITWGAPASVAAGTVLGATQLNATASVPGTFVYSPTAGTALAAGTQTLSTTFAPTDTTSYTTATSTVTVVVTTPSTPTITWGTPASVVAGTALGATQLNASASVPGTFAYTPAAGTALTAGTHTLATTFTPSDAINHATATATVTMVVTTPSTPTITWGTPASVVAGTALGATQLNASANVPGTFVYTPAAAAVLATGTHTLATTFTPTDTINFATATATITIVVTTPSTPTITWGAPASIVAGTALGATQLNASANVPGTFAYTPAAGAVLATGTQTLATTFAPTDTVNYTTATTTVSLVVTADGGSGGPIAPTITWATPASVVAGTALGATQMNATANVPGTFVYTPVAGTVLAAGTQTLATTFTPTDTTSYTTATKLVTMTVTPPVVPMITWANPASMVAGTALGATHLNATANVPGTFVYTPGTGAVLAAGTQTLATTFTPTDTTSYTTATKLVTMTVTPPVEPTITWANPASVVAGTALGATHLNATANVPGTFVYTPVAGAVLAAGTQTLATTFTPTDTASYTTATKLVTMTVTPPVRPTITWANPASVVAGTALGVTQLNASSGGVAGTFVYTPSLGTVLNTLGTQFLSAMFTPTDTINYTTATKTVTIVVSFVGPREGGGWSGTISGGNLLYRGGTYPIVNGRVNFPDCTTFIVAPNGALMGGGPTPNCTPSGGGGAGGLVTPTIAWATPGAVTVGTTLSATQLNASSGGVAGSFAYTPSLGMAMNTAGSQTLSVTFAPADLSAYTTATASVTLVVTASGGGGGGNFVGPANGGGWSGMISGGNLLYRGGTYQIVNGRVNFPDCTTFIVGPNGALMGGSATPNCTPSGGGGGLVTPTIAWATPAAVAVGTTLSATQLNASSGGVAGSFAYTPPLGLEMNTAGSQTLSVTFAPADLSAYTTATASVTLVVTTSGGGGSFVGPANGGGWSGTISGGNLLYRGGTYQIVNGRVNFPDCTTFIVGPNGALMGGSATPTCTPSGSEGGGLITPTITWAMPNSVTVGTVLSDTQLNASSDGVAGTYAYAPPIGTPMNTAGSQTLSVTFTPTDLASYTTTTKTVQLQVNGAGGAFIGPAAGGGWSGTISGEHLLYRGGTYPIVNGRVSFPDCTMFIVGPNGALMGGSAIPNCTPGGGA